PVFELPPGVPDEWEILARLAGIAQGLGADADPVAVDEVTIRSLVESAVRDDTCVIAGRNPDEIYEALSSPANGSLRGPDRILDLMLRIGPFGEGFGANPDGVSVAMLKRHPHGVDYGALVPRIPEVLRTPSGKIELAPPELLADVPRLRDSLSADPEQVLLVGRRHLRSNNSWMHNIRVLVKGKPRCTLHIHPDDAARLGVIDGAPVRVTSRVGSIVAPAEVGRPRVRRRELERVDRPRRDRPTFWQRRLERDSRLAQFCCDRVTISRRHQKIHPKIHHDPNCTRVGWHYRLWAEPQLRAVFYYP
ncbi:MAG: hypothetical protein EBT38_04030, partial [Acidimicrobiia bacterium]|nr:hypothetical protein [Acidimicrobiia bacterium]